MKIIFLGSSNFAVPSLEALLKSPQKVCCVVTQPDKKKGRHLRLAATDVKSVAQKAGLHIFQPIDVNSPESARYIAKFDPDLLVVVAYGQILSQRILALPKIFALNIHASILPKYRGAAPISWAIIRGEKTTGITVIQLTEKMDAGPMLLQKEIAISEDDDSLTLENKLRYLGANLLLEALHKIKEKTCKLTAQDERKATLAPKLKKNDGYIDWNKTAFEILNLIRGSLPWPGAFTYYKDRLLKISKAGIGPFVPRKTGAQGGGLVLNADKDLEIMADGSSLLIKELQPESKKKMSAAEFISGYKVKAGEIFGKK
ncbi:MAG: methionyl-tRNA formyltransferase [Candidatus Omnitrophica bacterium]|nr:methionyl-tRNA formyltransferase [Candidatus Omnitrophota bacterium]